MESRERITIVTSKEEKSQIISDAKKRGLTASAYIRLVLTGQLEPTKGEN